MQEPKPQIFRRTREIPLNLREAPPHEVKSSSQGETCVMQYDLVILYGTVQIIRVKNPNGVLHYGILATHFNYAGMIYYGSYVIDCTPELGVELRSVDDFAQGRQCDIVAYQNMFPPAQILANALSQIGQPYDLFSANCEQFTSWCATGAAKSDQLRNALVGGACLAVVALACMAT